MAFFENGHNHLRGILMDFKHNNELTATYIQLDLTKDTVEGQTQERTTTRVRFAGPWVKYLSEDLEIAWEICLDLNRFDPIWNQFEDRWEFNHGLQAVILLQDVDEVSWYMKTIELGATTCRPLRLPPFAASSASQTHRSTPLRNASRHLSSIKRSPSMDTKFSLGEASETIRTRLDSADPRIRSAHADRLTTPSRQGSVLHERATPSTSHKPDISSYCTDWNSPTQQSTDVIPLAQPSVHRLVQSTQAPGVPDFVNLQDVEDSTQAGTFTFNVYGLITRKKNNVCQRVRGGTQDLQMTLYLQDNSRSQSSPEVTCNLFWRTEEACPNWEKANWQVLFLWGVHKRYSPRFNTQIVGQSDKFGWALWAPPGFGSAEMLDMCKVGSSAVPPCFLNFEGSRILQRLAESLHGSLNRLTTPGLANPSDTDVTELSIPKRICDLQPREPQKVSLCVELIDLWHDPPANDRVTVTDYTSNIHIVPSDFRVEYDPGAQPWSRHHIDGGGTPENWPVTGQRQFTIYLCQPILEQFYRHIRGDLASDRAGVHELRESLLGLYVRLDHVVIRAASKGGFYGLIETVQSQNRYEDEAILDDEQGDRQIWRKYITLLAETPTESPELQPLFQARNQWAKELDPGS
ncbi:uncharacterized protein MELLADRAFT_76710 [Melampsora larici-populina 98AG31]|uniref:Uncharacterized protein n=1 Tax=Melampsora larici-populina (strain 98AG31 / pathotype 3-4-7) TaxID=747676 RepID=F4R760_MELLP|nr:uncharacterized protein MELLADRAFT_76710 [Melampsora larici-populina 98AG31]EGG11530.1 hypothetical protein MELLADRAFT_76710 [Melampsora larici-populina 98AG31]